MRKTAIVAGTSYDNRADLIKQYVRDGMAVDLVRNPHNPQDSNAIEVHLIIPRLGGLFGNKRVCIGHIKAGTAATLAKAIDNGAQITGKVKRCWAQEDRIAPRVSLEITDEQ